LGAATAGRTAPQPKPTADNGRKGAGTLEALFTPGSVAVVGASATPGKAGHAMVAALSGFGGTVFAVNPGRPVVNGSPAFTSVQEIDCNPLRLTRSGPVALDALVAVTRPSAWGD